MKKAKHPLRILQICNSLNCGSGVLNVVLNWHRHIEKTKVQFDYLTFLPTITQENCFSEIHALGGQIYYIPFSMRHPIRFLHQSYKFFKTHQYHTIHSHITHLNFFFFS